MFTLREPTTFDTVAPGGRAAVTEKSKNENLDPHEIHPEAILCRTLKPE